MFLNLIFLNNIYKKIYNLLIMNSIITKLYNKLETGDLILFNNTSTISCCIKYFTCSKYSHIGMILKDPLYINTKLKGLYLWQSSKENFLESEDNKSIYGVQISSLEKVLDECNLKNVYIRKLNLRLPINKDPLMISKLKKIHQEIHHHHYDLNPIDWLLAGEYELENWLSLPVNDKIILLNQKPTQVPSTVWCSSLIGFIYYNLNLIKNLNWKLLSPEDWSYKNNKLLQLDGCSLNKEILLNKFIK
tara:strand:+ start:10146 stop:10886 length:741 start_codon:yes stop_codon:yes gene_type:complete